MPLKFLTAAGSGTAADAAASAGEPMLLSWTASRDSGSGMSRYRISVDGRVVATVQRTELLLSALGGGRQPAVGRGHRPRRQPEQAGHSGSGHSVNGCVVAAPP